MESKIIVNARFLTQTLTGVQRYAMEILRRLPRLVLYSPSNSKDVYDELSHRHLIIQKTLRLGRASVQGHMWEQLLLPHLVPHQKKVLWSPGGSGPIRIRNQVITIHDLAHIEHPEWYDYKFAQYYKRLLPILLKKVKFIIANSKFTKSKIINLYNINQNKISVTYLGVDSRFSPRPHFEIESVKRRYNLSKPYFISVSSLSERKNLNRLQNAWKLAKCKRDIDLIVIGASGLSFAGKKKTLFSPDVKYLGYVPDEDLPALYSGAIGALYVSLYEGFGLPALEAMASGTPLIASNTGALPEIVDNAGVMVDPYDIDSIADGIKTLVDNSELRKELMEKGLKRAKLFSWDKTAEQTWEILKIQSEEI